MFIHGKCTFIQPWLHFETDLDLDLLGRAQEERERRRKRSKERERRLHEAEVALRSQEDEQKGRDLRTLSSSRLVALSQPPSSHGQRRTLRETRALAASLTAAEREARETRGLPGLSDSQKGLLRNHQLPLAPLTAPAATPSYNPSSHQGVEQQSLSVSVALPRSSPCKTSASLMWSSPRAVTSAGAQLHRPWRTDAAQDARAAAAAAAGGDVRRSRDRRLRSSVFPVSPTVLTSQTSDMSPWAACFTHALCRQIPLVAVKVPGACA